MEIRVLPKEHFSPKSSSENLSRRSLVHLLRVGCGALRRWLGGSSDVLAGLMCGRSGAGSTCGSWVILRRFLGPLVPRLIPKSRKPLKKELPRKVAKLKEAYPQAEVQLWAEETR